MTNGIIQVVLTARYLMTCIHWYHTTSDMERDPDLRPFDEFGNYRGPSTHRRTPEYDGFDINMVTYTVNLTHMCGHLHKLTTEERDYASLRPFFLWHSPSMIELTYKNTTLMQYARRCPQLRSTIHDTYKSPFLPLFNVLCRHEPVATDTIVSKIPAINGYTCAQIFVGRHSHIIDVFPMHTSPKEFVNTLEDVIRKRGSMDKQAYQRPR
jgi:hypothetical protein